MALWDKYIADAATHESETPADTLPEGKYPAEVINARLEAVEGTSAKGAYAFSSASVQLRVLDGPLKGQTVWVNRVNNLGYDPGGELEQDKKRLYWTQHFYDATGLGLRLDPSWRRGEKPHPRKPGKMMTTFSGKVLTREQLFSIAKDEQVAAEFCTEKLVGLRAIWKLGLRSFETDAGSGEAQSIKDVTPMTDANLNAWRTEMGSGAAAGPSDSLYAK